MTRRRKIGGVISIVGSVVAVAFGYVNVTRLFLVNSTTWDYVAFAIASALLALVGALPGIVIGWIISPRVMPPTRPNHARQEAERPVDNAAVTKNGPD